MLSSTVRFLHGPAEHFDGAGSGGVVGPEAGDEAEDGRFAAAARAEDADELAVAGAVFDGEGDVFDDGVAVFGTVGKGFRDLVEVDDFQSASVRWGNRPR
jgi:hypothetical protein